MTSIRHATPADFPHLARLAAQLHAESPVYRGIPLELEKLRMVSDKLVSSPDNLGGVLVAEAKGRIVGLLAFIVTEHYFSSRKFATDLCVYVEPAYRGSSAFVKLVLNYQQAAKAMGAVEAIIGASTGISTERTVNMLGRLGYGDPSVSLRKGLADV